MAVNLDPSVPTSGGDAQPPAERGANPAPLGLLGFGVTTVLLNLHNAGFYSLDSMILGMGIFYGGIAQIIAGILEWNKNNTFGTTAFTSYGLFWLSLAGAIVIEEVGWGEAPETTAMAAYLLMWGLFTAGMFLATLRINRALQFIFASLAILFFLLSAAEAADSGLLRKIAGWEGVVCGFAAAYTGLAYVLNEVYGRTIAPIGTLK